MFDALIILGIILILLTVPLLIRLVWNIRLIKFQKRNFIKPSTNQRRAFSNNLVATSLLLVLGLFSIVGGSRKAPVQKGIPTLISFEDYVSNNKLYENAKSFSSQDEFNSIFSDINSNYNTYRILASPSDADFSLGLDHVDFAENAPKGGNNISDTYEQVMGVTEGDVAKYTSDGKYIIYVNRAKQALHKITLNEHGEVTNTSSVKLDPSFYFQDMLLHEDKIILFSYANIRIQYMPWISSSLDLAVNYPFYYSHMTTKYFIYDLNTLTLTKEAELLGQYKEIRQVDDILYVATNDYVNGNTVDDSSFKNVYYFQGRFNSRAISRLYAISLTTDEIISDIGFVGSLDAFYLGNGKIILSNTRWLFSEEESLYVTESNIIVVNYHLGFLEYAGSAVVEGIAEQQYFIDVRGEYIRVVTTKGRNDSNALYIFKENKETDKLTLVGSLTSGIGKPNETVKSVTYTDTDVKIVTFYQRDPLYTISLVNPKKPKITNVAEEPGFSSGLIAWDEKLGFTIGIGYMADENGITNGIKISAYSDKDEEPLQTIEFSYQKYGYLQTPALYDQRKNLLVNKNRGVIAFISRGFNNTNDAKVLLFDIDFNRKTPIVLNEVLFEKSFDYNYGYNIDKLLLFNDYIHILGSEGVYTFNTRDNSLGILNKFELEKPINYEVYYQGKGYFGEVVFYEHEGIEYTRKNIQTMVSSKEELLALIKEWKNNAFNEDSDEYNNAVNQAIRLCDEEFFQTKNLIIHTFNRSKYYQTSASSVTVNNLEVIFTIEAVYGYYEQGDYQTIIIAVDKEDVDGLTLKINYKFI
jgi:uncharacterized secreted protein with C-terminal beta-propeller domain